MKLKFAALTIVATGFLASCGDSQNTAPKEINLGKAPTNTQTTPPIKQEQQASLQKQNPEALEEKAPQNGDLMTQESLEQEVKVLADALSYEGDETPRQELEQEISEVLKAVRAEEIAELNNSNK